MDNHLNRIEDRNGQKRCHHHNGWGSSSYSMQNPELVFKALDLKEGDFFLDIGCGSGDYALHASRIVGDKGTILAFDINWSIIERLRSEVERSSLGNINVMVRNATEPMPLMGGSIDVCLISTMLHIIGLNKRSRAMIEEVARVLKPGGRLAIIECKKGPSDFGPPEKMRISPEDIDELTANAGFTRSGLLDMGNNYLVQYMKDF